MWDVLRTLIMLSKILRTGDTEFLTDVDRRTDTIIIFKHFFGESYTKMQFYLCLFQNRSDPPPSYFGALFRKSKLLKLLEHFVRPNSPNIWSKRAQQLLDLVPPFYPNSKNVDAQRVPQKL